MHDKPPYVIFVNASYILCNSVNTAGGCTSYDVQPDGVHTTIVIALNTALYDPEYILLHEMFHAATYTGNESHGTELFLRCTDDLSKFFTSQYLPPWL